MGKKSKRITITMECDCTDVFPSNDIGATSQNIFSLLNNQLVCGLMVKRLKLIVNPDKDPQIQKYLLEKVDHDIKVAQQLVESLKVKVK